MGAGTMSSYESHFLFCHNPSFSLTGKDNYTTWGFWIRLKTGESIIIKKWQELWKDEVTQSDDITLTTSDGWTYVVTCTQVSMGYSPGFPYIYANENDVIQIAIPVCFRGLVYPGKPTSPTGKAVGTDYAVTGVNCDITSMTGLDNNGILKAKVEGTIKADEVDANLSGTQKVFTIYSGDTPYYFKGYPTKT